MSLSDAQLRLIRDEIGDATPPTDDDLEDAFEEVGEVWQQVAISVLSRRRATILGGSTKGLTIPGVVSVQSGVTSFTASQDLLKQINRLRAQLGGMGGRLASPYRRGGGRQYGEVFRREPFRL